MKYIRIQRRNTDGFITIGEYIRETEPRIHTRIEVLKAILCVTEPVLKLWGNLRDVTELVLTAADISGKDKQYQYLMTERPRSGRGGLAPGETEEDL